MKQRLLTLLVLVSIPALACDTGGEMADEAGAEMEQATETMESEAAAGMGMTDLPDTTAQAVWSYLQEVSYADEWRMWPGTTALYEGTDPHGMLLTTYLNDEAYEALTQGSGPLPNGSIVVKENYQQDSTLAALTIMFSAEGYDAEHNDYFWAKYGPDGDVQAAGRVESCQQCHAQGDRGYLRTAFEGGAGGM